MRGYLLAAEEGRYVGGVRRMVFDHVDINRHPVFAATVTTAQSLYRQFRTIKQSTFSAFVAMIFEVDAADADEFIRGILTGADLSADDPRLTLRNYLAKPERRDDRSERTLAIMVKGWNAWRDNKPFRLAHIQSQDESRRCPSGLPCCCRCGMIDTTEGRSERLFSEKDKPMLALKPAPVSTRQLTYFADKNTFVGDMSEIRGFGRVHNDSCDEGFTLVSSRTGMEVVVVVIEVHTDAEGDITHWDLVPTDPSRNFTVTIFND